MCGSQSASSRGEKEETLGMGETRLRGRTWSRIAVPHEMRSRPHVIQETWSNPHAPRDVIKYSRPSGDAVASSRPSRT
jgi:hypothetical protein